MKYPQLVRMPSAVQDWLHEQLEARGIDAVVYTRYVLSLLQRDSIDLSDDLFSFPAEKEKESGRRGRKHGRLEEGWDVRDSEQLKRSAAVECLMSASDQKCGIEKLVDELCAKLKEAQDEGALHTELKQKSTTQTPPSGEQNLEYHTAFPPLNNSKSTEQSKILLDSNSVWNNRKILATLSEKSDSLHGETIFVTSNKRGNLDYESVQVMKSFGLDKDIGYGFALKMAAERNFGCLDFSSGEDSGNEMKVFRRNHENSDDLTCRRLYERQAEDEESLYSGMLDENTEEFYGDEDGSIETSKQNAEDSNLAQLIAKFDHSIEALWNPDDETPPPTTAVEDPLNCENDLPVDFRRLLSSPEDDSLAMELVDLGSKPHPEELRPRNTFIQCGTNIISSIWSERPSQDSSMEHENFSSVDYMNSSILEEKNKKNKSFVTGQRNGNTKIDLQSDTQSENKSDKEKMNIFLKNMGNVFDNKNHVPVNKLQSFSSLFTSLPWDLNYSMKNFKNEVIANKWSNFANEPSAAVKNNIPDDTATNDTTVNDSYVLLNHNRKDSSFIEVIPKQSGASAVQQWLNACDQYQAQTSDDSNVKDGSVKEEEDLLTSNRTHFRPIRQENIDNHHNHNAGPYADGTTFVIPNKLDDVTFKRSESGSLYLESDGASGIRRKYMEYKEKEPYGGRHEMDYHMEIRDFIPKFQVRESEKCCQTEGEEDACMSDDEVDTKRSRQACGESDEFFFPGDDQFARKVIDHFDNGHNHSTRETRRSVRKALFHIPAKHDSPHNGNPFLQATFMQPGGVFQQTDLTLQCTISQMPPFEWNNSTSQTRCRCGSGSWKNGWLKNYSEIQKGAWYQWDPKKPCSFSHQWYDIWSTESETSKLCESCASSRVVGAPNDESHFLQHENCSATNNTDSMHHEELREELSRDGDQLLHDLSYLRHLFLGPDIPEDSVMAARNKSLFVKEESISSSQAYDEWKSNERPFMAKATPKDRKRRHSATQKECSLPQEVVGIPCISMDAAHCLKGIVARPFFYGGAHTLRPVTL